MSFNNQSKQESEWLAKELFYQIEISILQEKIQKLLIAGRATSNCCYNIGQQGGRVLNQRDANSLYQSAQDWDIAVNEVSKIE